MKVSNLPKGSLDVVAALREAKSILATEAADEIERLRAELAAERKLKNIYFDEWQDANKENVALRALLWGARDYLKLADADGLELLARIDALLNKGGVDE